MKPLLRDKKQGEPKLKAEKSDHVGGYSKGVSQYDKLTTRNANRGMTKGVRQESKRNLKKYLDMSFE
jgi:hypothetical protein